MLEKLTGLHQVRSWHGEMPVSHRYTAGLAGETFFRALKDNGTFLATRCENCGVTYCPARAFCERCLSPLDDYFEVGPEGTLESFTVVYRDLDEQPLVEPVVIGLIRLVGADTALVHRLEVPSRAVLRTGIPLEPVLKPKASREGSLNDVEYFKPVVGPRRR
jgi:uncharacterized OB-fold protein